MKQENVIEVRDVHKKFKSYTDKGNSLKEKIIYHKKSGVKENWVLKGIDFEVRRGEALGLIGRNGCGKSTTLKLLTKILYPDKGVIDINGRVSSLLELGAGFHPDLSGYENIYLNASVFGLTRKEIDCKLEEIIDFSELREFINNPIRTYSSGTYMKLAFSVAINVDADILLIDEILGVGDISFQQKCFEKLLDIKRSGTTIIIVSHSTGQIERICDRTIWLEDGIIKDSGIPPVVNEKYILFMEEMRIRRKNQEDGETLKNILEEEIKQSQFARMTLQGEIEKRRERREILRKQYHVDCDRESMKEKLIKEIETARQKNAEYEERVKEFEDNKDITIIDMQQTHDLTKKEVSELYWLIKKKDLEIERLQSIVDKDKLEGLWYENTIMDKEDEEDRLNFVIMEKEAEIERVKLNFIEQI